MMFPTRCFTVGPARTAPASRLPYCLICSESTTTTSEPNTSDRWTGGFPGLIHDELSDGEPDEGYRTVTAVITLTLEKLQDRYGTIEQMLLESGMSADLPDRLRAALLEQPESLGSEVLHSCTGSALGSAHICTPILTHGLLPRYEVIRDPRPGTGLHHQKILSRIAPLPSVVGRERV